MAESLAQAIPTEAALDKLENQLICGICLGRYTDPRALPCQHVYCMECLEDLINRSELDEFYYQQQVKCPNCRIFHQVERTSTLPKAFYINNLLEIEKLLRGNDSQHPECPEHNKPKEMFCETCGELVCLRCSRESHSGHQCDIAEEVYEKHKQEITDCLQPVDEKIEEATKMLTVFDKREEEIQDQSEAVKKEIHQIMQGHTDKLQEIMATIQQSKKLLCDRTETATREKIILLKLEKEELEMTLKQLMSCKKFVDEEMKSRSRYQIQPTACKNELVQRIGDAHAKVKVSDFQPKQIADTSFHCPAIEAYCQQMHLGSVSSSLSYQAFLGMFKVNFSQSVPTKEITEVSIMTALPLSAESLHCAFEVVDNRFGKVEVTPPVKITEGHFKITIKPDKPGQHQLSVHVCVGKDNIAHVQGSPFQVTAVSLPEWRSEKMKVFVNGLRQPHGIVVTDDGKHVVLTENARQCGVVVFSTITGELLRKFGRHGTGSGEFVNPEEVKVSCDNHIFVKDKTRIQKFTWEGLCVDSIHIKEIGGGMAILPCGSVLTSSQSHQTKSRSLSFSLSLPLARSTQNRHSIYKISPDFKEIELFSNSFDGEPNDIAMDTEGKVYVLTLKSGIHILTAEGMPISKFTSYLLDNVYQFCISSSNMIYITNRQRNSSVSVFTTKGECIGSFGKYSKLRGITVSKNGDLYISKNSGKVLVATNRQ